MKEKQQKKRTGMTLGESIIKDFILMLWRLFFPLQKHKRSIPLCNWKFDSNGDVTMSYSTSWSEFIFISFFFIICQCISIWVLYMFFEIFLDPNSSATTLMYISVTLIGIIFVSCRTIVYFLCDFFPLFRPWFSWQIRLTRKHLEYTFFVFNKCREKKILSERDFDPILLYTPRPWGPEKDKVYRIYLQPKDPNVPCFEVEYAGSYIEKLTELNKFFFSEIVYNDETMSIYADNNNLCK